ncbi:Lrp/AsnC family transcriptional regulator [Microcella frigidaquae]|uniref:DNA-binding Lrp family transcriptional regulator n=1 Tax=Microcella frigidaquae TaxID=424758 RepID=A0A840XGG6_9MICO|nr:Lrp/AsnC family transcriptional regulator [Microcella frigidaquae]MBB5617582.1 DNA-binding Lrp family transcriptional regulator [Microcella frigidaquae]NHN45756.1 Lrp/AsnC family transcriptional regulator [Microcella frigidaquae]
MVRSSRILDPTSRRIVRALDRDPRAAVGGLAETLGLARGTVQSRIAQLFDGRTLRPTSTTVPPETLGYSIRAVVTAEVDQDRFEEAMVALQEIPTIIECVATSGQNDLLCQVVARDTDDLYAVGQRILRCPGIRRTATSIVLKELIAYRTIPLLES